MLLRKKSKKSEKRQLGFELKPSRFELFYKFKRLTTQVEKSFTVLPFWRNGLIWMAISTIIGITIITTLIIGKSYLKLPEQVPLIYDTLEEDWQSFPKIYFFGVPLILVLIGILNIQLLQKVYYMNKKLTLMICILITLTYFLGLAAVNEILIICTS